MKMKRMRGVLSCLALFACLLSQSGAYADGVARNTQISLDASTTLSTSATQNNEPRSRYVDGTGDMLVDRLNESQLDENYKGPVYYPGQPIPSFRGIDTDHLSRSGPETAKKTFSSHVR